MVKGNKFKPKPVVVVGPAAAAVPTDQPDHHPPLPTRDGTRAASTTERRPAAERTGKLEAVLLKPAVSAAHANGKEAVPTPGVSAGKAPAKPAPPPQPPRRLAVPTLVAPPTPAAGGTAKPTIGAVNWLALKAAASIGKKHPEGGGKRKGKPATPATPTPTHGPAPSAIGSTSAPTRILAMDCEMVGVGPGGVRSALARVCIVNEAGAVLLDTHVAPRERVTDYRTRVSGVTPTCLRGAPDLGTVRERVERLIAGRLLVGHAITHDLTALMVSHPRALTRDTARYPPLMRATAPGRRPKPRRLRDLAAEVLGLAIQGGAHSPVDDARAALYLYQHARREWEAAAKKPGGVARHLSPPVRGGGGSGGGKAAVKAAAVDAAAALGELAARDDMADL